VKGHHNSGFESVRSALNSPFPLRAAVLRRVWEAEFEDVLARFLCSMSLLDGEERGYVDAVGEVHVVALEYQFLV
jgi:hypothetical protein